jgi:hypothetical protein
MASLIDVPSPTALRKRRASKKLDLPTPLAPYINVRGANSNREFLKVLKLRSRTLVSKSVASSPYRSTVYFHAVVSHCARMSHTRATQQRPAPCEGSVTLHHKVTISQGSQASEAVRRHVGRGPAWTATVRLIDEHGRPWTVLTLRPGVSQQRYQGIPCVRPSPSRAPRAHNH